MTILNLSEKKDIDFNEWTIKQIKVLAKAWCLQLDLDQDIVFEEFSQAYDSSTNPHCLECKCNFLDAFDYFFRDYVNWINDPRPSFYSDEVPF